MPSVHDELQAGLADRYVLDREIGRGGMATVYLAHDRRHDRPVALKVLDRELAATLGAARFLQEIKLAAGLQHPHILPVYDSGETTGFLWFTMPYIDGESLRGRLTREKRLSPEEAVRIACETAEALDFAHRRGVIHRDIKPDNILLADGHVLVADFGVGRPADISRPGARLTGYGLVVGTPAYMAPEQVVDGPVDGRSDLYSLGVVIYEMLVGEPPFTGPTAQAVMVKRLTAESPGLRARRPTVPRALDGAVGKALAPAPENRFQTGAELARALKAALAASISSSSDREGTRKPREGVRAPLLTVFAIGILLGAGVLITWRRSTLDVEPVIQSE